MNSLNHNKIIIFFLLFSTIALSQEYDGILAEDVFIKLDVFTCARCSIYSVTIKGDGKVEYEGRNKVSKMGRKTKGISTNKISELLSHVLKAQFFKRTDESIACYPKVEIITSGNYEESSICVTSSHGPIIEITVRFGNQYREIELQNLFSDDYTKLKNKIIETAGIKRWIREK